MNQDFRDTLSALSDAGAEFLTVGAHALAAHGYPRATGNLDIWVRPTKANADRVWRAIERFGAPHRGLQPDVLCDPDVVFQIGVSPNRIDMLTSITDVDFDDAWKNRKTAVVEDLSVGILGRGQLLINKRALGRPKDLADADWLE